MDRLIPEIEKAYRTWKRSLAKRRDTAFGKIAAGLNRGALAIARGKAKPVKRGKHRRSPEAREKMRQAALKRWAKAKRAA